MFGWLVCLPPAFRSRFTPCLAIELHRPRATSKVDYCITHFDDSMKRDASAVDYSDKIADPEAIVLRKGSTLRHQQLAQNHVAHQLLTLASAAECDRRQQRPLCAFRRLFCHSKIHTPVVQ